MAAPKITKTTPVARFKTTALALFANLAAILAHKRVNTIHSTNICMSGSPPMAKWLIAPVNAVNAIINTLVPTAVFNS